MMQCSACNSSILVTHKRIKCTNGNCSHCYHAECVKYNESSAARAKWICPICITSRPRDSDNSKSPLHSGGQKENIHKIPSMPPSTSSVKLDTATILDEIRSLRQDMHVKFEVQQESLNKFHSTLHTVQQDIRDMGNRLSTMRDEFDEVSKSVNFLAQQYDDQIQLNQKHDSLYCKLQTENLELITKLNNFNIRINQMEQQARDCNLEIQCVPEFKNENLLSIIKQLRNTVSSDISDSEILNFHRVAKINPESSRPRSIVVKFSTPRSRDNLLAAVKTFNKSNLKEKLNSAHLGIGGEIQQVYVIEHLSPENKKLHSETRRVVKEKNYQFVWVRSGRIFVRKDIKSPPLLVKDMAFLNSL